MHFGTGFTYFTAMLHTTTRPHPAPPHPPAHGTAQPSARRESEAGTASIARGACRQQARCSRTLVAARSTLPLGRAHLGTQALLPAGAQHQQRGRRRARWLAAGTVVSTGRVATGICAAPRSPAGRRAAAAADGPGLRSAANVRPSLRHSAAQHRTCHGHLQRRSGARATDHTAVQQHCMR